MVELFWQCFVCFDFFDDATFVTKEITQPRLI
jgi:hypothetical protein